MEFACPQCGVRMRLIPHGQGRYARPGEPPPPPVPWAERAPPWVGREQAEAARRAAEPSPPPTAPPPRPPPPPAREPQPHPPAPPPEAPGDGAEDAPLTVPLDALELLGVEPTAARRDIERAFREKSRRCHPDKVAHLDPEFQALAERKFKRLKSAYDLLAR